MIRKKNKLNSIVIAVILLIYSCNKIEKSNYAEVDGNFSFRKVEIIENDSLKLKRYLINGKSDSVYNIIVDSKQIVSRGWTYNFTRIGDWFFESKERLDSVYNYVNYCGGIHHINTIKYFNNNKPLYNKGYWHEFIYDSTNIKKDERFEVEMKINYDKELYQENLILYLFRDPVYNADYCDFKQFKKDSLPSFGDDNYTLGIRPVDEGINTIQGYYILLPKKQDKVDGTIGVKAIFFRLDFEVN